MLNVTSEFIDLRVGYADKGFSTEIDVMGMTDVYYVRGIISKLELIEYCVYSRLELPYDIAFYQYEVDYYNYLKAFYGGTYAPNGIVL